MKSLYYTVILLWLIAVSTIAYSHPPIAGSRFEFFFVFVRCLVLYLSFIVLAQHTLVFTL